MCLLAAHLLQCRSSLWLNPGSRFLLSCFYIVSLWLWRFLWVGRKRVVFTPFSSVDESKALAKSAKIFLPLGFFFARTPSRIQRMIQICDVGDLFLRKPFWFFQVCSQFWVLCGCVVEHCISWPLWILRLYLGSSWLSEVTLLKEGEDTFICPSVYCILTIYGITVSEQYVVELPGRPLFWGHFLKPCSFLF